MKNAEKIVRKNKVAQDYIDKISDNEEYFSNINEINKNLFMFKKDVEKTWLTHKTKQALQDFLVTENIFEWVSDQIFKQNFSAIALMSFDGKEKINKAKKIINNSQKTEQEVREELGLVIIDNKIKEEKPQKNTTEVITTNIEILKTDEKFIYNQAIKYGVTDKKQIAYILATVKWESWFKNIKERWWENKSYGKKWYYGRGFVQLTHKWNYRKFNKIIKNSWINFKDNKWNIMQDIDIVNNPDSILSSNELAAFILIHGMQKGLFRWKWNTRYSLDHFINSDKTDFYNARSIINGMSSAPSKYQSYAKGYLANLEKNQNLEKNRISETLIVWDSHVWWLQMGNYPWDTKHFNWYDTSQLYKEISNWGVDLDWKKSVVLYTGSNDITKNTVWKMGNNLKKIYEELQKKWVNLILCTLPENSTKGKDIAKVNGIITEFAKSKWLQIIDTNSHVSIAQNEYATDGIHFNSAWYQKISQEIESHFA